MKEVKLKFYYVDWTTMMMEVAQYPMVSGDRDEGWGLVYVRGEYLECNTLILGKKKD